MAKHWPDTLWIVRHGQSAGNIARDAAEAAALEVIALEMRDVDVPLSPLGERQAEALGRWFAAMPAEQRPNVVLASTYRRAQSTAQLIARAGGLASPDVEITFDERLREREFGILDQLTKAGIIARHPEQAELRKRFGKFYHRPPGGESWCDINLRLRSVLEWISREHAGQRVLIVCHSVVVLCFRYLLERLTEDEILKIDRETEVANCSVTGYAYHPDAGPRGAPGGGLALRAYNFVAPLEQAGEPVTSRGDKVPAEVAADETSAEKAKRSS
jgi:2,3-bisphosphoglycerate-dependent phosphoglycerate mutase